MSSLYSSVQVPRDSSQKLISSRTFIETMKKYMPSILTPGCVDMPIDRELEFMDDDGLKAVQHVLDSSKGLLGMYENALNVTAEIKNFGDFIGNFKFLEMDDCEPYNHTVQVYKSLKDEEFINRKDLFPLIQSIVLHSIPEMRHDIAITVLSLFLRIKEYKMNRGYMEFIKYSDDLLHDFSAVLYSEDFKKKLNDVPKGKRLIPRNKTAAIKLWFEFIDGCQILDDDIPTSMDGFYNQDVYWKWQVTLEAMETFIASRDDLFTSSSSNKRTVRLFEDGPERFVFASELAIALDKKYTEKHEFKMMVVQDQFLERLAHIDFIRTPIGRTKNRAIPITTPRGRYAILGSDCLIELLHQFIDMEIFQCATPETVQLALNKLENVFCVHAKEKKCCSIPTSTLLESGIREILLRDTPKARKISSSVTNGFTLEEFKESIETIGIKTVFPNILEYSRMAYEYVTDGKEAEALTTYDLFKCLKICQMMSIMEMSPNLKNFLHDQKACNRVVGIGCMQCPEISIRVLGSPNRIVENLGFKEEETKEMTIVEPVEEPVEEIQEENIVENEKKNRKKARKQSKPSTSSSSSSSSSSDEGVESSDEVIVNKQSNNCLKCFRTSERCNQVKEKLKQEQKKNKEKEKKISEQAMEIQELRAQLAALQSSQQVAPVVIESSESPESPESPEVDPPEIPELSQKMKNLLFDFQTKRNSILNDNPAPKASQKAFRLKSKATDLNDKLGAEVEFKKFCNSYEQYMNALEVNINRIQSRTQRITPSDLLKIPEFPTLSSGFLEAYERIVTKPEEEKAAAVLAAKKKKEEEEEREKECQICYNEMTSSDETLKCPHCPKTFHSSCISDWINVSPTCPNCRGKFLNPVEFPPLS